MIDERIRKLGLAPGGVTLESYCIDIVSYYQEEKLGQDTVVLVSQTLDVPYTAQIIIDGGNNKLETSKEDFERLSYAGYQFFQDQISITTSNYGIDFVPYRLEFIKISPIEKNQNHDTQRPKEHQ